MCIYSLNRKNGGGYNQIDDVGKESYLDDSSIKRV